MNILGEMTEEDLQTVHSVHLDISEVNPNNKTILAVQDRSQSCLACNDCIFNNTNCKYINCTPETSRFKKHVHFVFQND